LNSAWATKGDHFKTKKTKTNKNLELFINSSIMYCVISCHIPNYPKTLYFATTINIYYVSQFLWLRNSGTASLCVPGSGSPGRL
jgi:hypothetical protein